LWVKTQKGYILKGVSMKFEDSKVYAILGPNGSGKTTLAKAIMGIQKISKGKIFFNSKDITKLSPEKRAKLGIFLGFQQTPELEVSLQNLLFAIDGEKAYEKINKLKSFVEELDIDLKRELIGLSGGEKKKLELFEFLYMQPKFAILDEPDSGVDIDSFKKIVKAIDFARKEFNPTLVIISHYENIFNYIEPSFVYVLKDGKVAKSGGKELIERIKRYGYE
jgi:Fe-S cluster assembly ATP-binding protein